MKKRIDALVVERGMAPNIKAAGALVMAGEVIVGEQRIDKVGMQVAEDATIRLRTKSQYVSRGGDKLASVAAALALDFEGKTVIDVGSSTGGFTDYALAHGANRVFAVEVGRNQLDYKLRQDPRVVVMEETDIRSVKSLPELVDLILIDVSFIKLDKVLPAVVNLLTPQGLIVAMVKPQFEANKATADQFNGVISDESIRQEIITNFRQQIADQFEIVGEADSAVLGPKGNHERFMVLKPLNN